MRTEAAASGKATFCFSLPTSALVSAMTLALTVAFMLGACTEAAWASVTKVGNGDDGGDLEGGQKITSGILVETRDKALQRARTLNVHSVQHLGSLLAELEKSEIYFVSRDMAPKLAEDHGGLEGSPDGKLVYARTFAEPHAATRFFPAALMLNEEQLIALHIHEALHRSLPPSVREDERAVTKITLAISAPDSSHDRIRRVTAAAIPDSSSDGPGFARARLAPQAEVSQSLPPPLEKPSSITYNFRSFMTPDKDKASYPVESMHSIQSFLYPFGVHDRAVGLGIELSYIKGQEQAFLGPLALSGRMKFMTFREFDVGGFATFSLNTTSAEEIKNTPLGRDIITFGLSARRNAPAYYVENLISLTAKSEAPQKVGNITYTHNYGSVTAATVRAGAKFAGLEAGGFAEILLADAYSVTGGAWQGVDTGRYRIIAAGPELAYSYDALRFGLSARWVIDSTPGVNLDTVGDIMGRGVGQGFINTSASLRF